MKSLKRKLHIKPSIPSPDTKYSSMIVAKFQNYVMFDGEKQKAVSIVNKFIDNIIELINNHSIKGFEIEENAGDEILKKIIERLRMEYEIRRMKFGGCGYQIPVLVNPLRQQFSALKLFLRISRANAKKQKKNIVAALTHEGTNILNGLSGSESIRKVVEVQKIVKANKALEKLHRTRSSSINKKKFTKGRFRK